MPPQDPVVDKIVAHAERVEAHGVPEAARAAAKSFIADTLAVAVAGVATPWRRDILDLLAAGGGAAEATVFGTGGCRSCMRRCSTLIRCTVRNSTAYTRPR